MSPSSLATKAAWISSSTAVISGASFSGRWRAARTVSVTCAGGDLHRRQHQAALAPADQLQIDFRRQLGVQQRAVLGARRQVDAKALAQFVQRIARAGNLALGDFDGVDGARQRNARAADPLQFGIDELDVEAGIVDHQRRVAQEFQEFLHHMGEQRLVGQEFRRQAMHPLGFDGHVAFGIQIELQGAAGGDMIHQLDAADFHDAMPVARLKACGFGIEDDLTH